MNTIKTKMTGSALKWIAILTMLIDHMAAALLDPLVYGGYYGKMHGLFFGSASQSTFIWYMIGRFIGRLAFPIFCFLLVEGITHTRDIKKYGARLALFALISEIPFDLALLGSLSFDAQNVFFTLLFGLLSIYCIQQIPRSTLWAGGAVVWVVLSQLLHTDYGAFGVLFIILLYLLRADRKKLCIAGAVAVLWEITAPLAFVPIYYYNNERGRQNKYFFYLFYPGHLLLIYLIRQGLSGQLPFFFGS